MPLLRQLPVRQLPFGSHELVFAHYVRSWELGALPGVHHVVEAVEHVGTVRLVLKRWPAHNLRCRCPYWCLYWPFGSEVAWIHAVIVFPFMQNELVTLNRIAELVCVEFQGLHQRIHMACRHMLGVDWSDSRIVGFESVWIGGVVGGNMLLYLVIWIFSSANWAVC